MSTDCLSCRVTQPCITWSAPLVATYSLTEAPGNCCETASPADLLLAHRNDARWRSSRSLSLIPARPIVAPCSTSVQTGAWTVISLFAACYGQAGTSTAGAVEASWRIQHGSRNTRSPGTRSANYSARSNKTTDVGSAVQGSSRRSLASRKAPLSASSESTD